MMSTSPKRLRIAVLNRIFRHTGGGAERYSIALVEQLAQRHEMHVFAQQLDHQRSDVHYHRIPLPFVRPRWLNQLWFAMATWWQTRRGFDVVHSHENTWHGSVQTVHVVPVTHSLLHGLSGARLAMRWIKIATSPRLLVYLALERARYNVADGRCIVLASRTQLPVMASSFPQAVAACKVVTPGVAAVTGRSTPMQRAAAAGVGVEPLSPRYLGPPRQGLVLGFRHITTERLPEAVERLEQVLARIAHSPRSE